MRGKGKSNPARSQGGSEARGSSKPAGPAAHADPGADPRGPRGDPAGISCLASCHPHVRRRCPGSVFFFSFLFFSRRFGASPRWYLRSYSLLLV